MGLRYVVFGSILAMLPFAGRAQDPTTVYDFFDNGPIGTANAGLRTYDLATETLLVDDPNFGTVMGTTLEGTGVDNGLAYQFWDDGVGSAALAIFDIASQTLVSMIPDFSVMGTGGHGGIGVDNGIVYEFWNDGVGSIALSTYDLATQTLLSTDLDFGPLGFDSNTQAGGMAVDNGIVYQFWNDGAGSIAVSAVDLATEVQLSVDLDFSVMPIGGHGGIGVSSSSAESQPVVLAGPIRNGDTGNDYYLLEASRWGPSEAKAVSLGGHLASIGDAAENLWVLSTFGSFGGVFRTLWIGLTDTASEGSFGWVNGDPVAYTNWGVGQPSGGGSGVDFVAMASPAGAGGKWSDAGDALPYYGVVEVRFGGLCRLKGPGKGGPSC